MRDATPHQINLGLYRLAESGEAFAGALQTLRTLPIPEDRRHGLRLRLQQLAAEIRSQLARPELAEPLTPQSTQPNPSTTTTH